MKTLIVDDEKLALSRLKRILTEEGISDITECNNPIDAIKEFSKAKFDVAFLDISMPTMTGLELANTLLEINPNTFIIFQTAFAEYALEAFKSGGLDYILKPISNESIQKALQKIEKYVKNIESDEKMQDMQELLKGKNFFRVHRSYIVNVDKIKSMRSVEQSKLEISFKDIDDIVTSSKDGAKEFREYIEQRTL